MATWLLRDRKTAQVIEGGEGGGEEGAGETESEGGRFVPWGGWRRQSKGTGLVGGGDKLAF